MKQTKRLLSVLLAFVLVLGLLPMSALEPKAASTGKMMDCGIAGIEMLNGYYLANGASAGTTTKPASGGYAYYNDHVLTLNNFRYSGMGALDWRDVSCAICRG